MLHIFKLSKLSPGSWHHVVLVIFLIHYTIVESRITDPHQVVQADTAFNDVLHNGRPWLHGGEEDFPSLGQDSKCILHHTSTPADPVVLDPLVPLEIPLTIWLHQEGPDSKGISQDKVWHWLVMFRYVG